MYRERGSVRVTVSWRRSMTREPSREPTSSLSRTYPARSGRASLTVAYTVCISHTPMVGVDRIRRGSGRRELPRAASHPRNRSVVLPELAERVLDVHEGEGSLCALDVKDYATGEMFLQVSHSGNRLSRVVPQRVQTTERSQSRHDELVLVLGEDVAVADVGEHLHGEEVRAARDSPEPHVLLRHRGRVELVVEQLLLSDIHGLDQPLRTGHALVVHPRAEEIRGAEQVHPLPRLEDEPLQDAVAEVFLDRPPPMLMEEHLPDDLHVGEPVEERSEDHVPLGVGVLHHLQHVLRPAIQDAEVVAELQLVEDRVVRPRPRQADLPSLPDHLPLVDVTLVQLDWFHSHAFRLCPEALKCLVIGPGVDSSAHSPHETRLLFSIEDTFRPFSALTDFIISRNSASSAHFLASAAPPATAARRACSGERPFSRFLRDAAFIRSSRSSSVFRRSASMAEDRRALSATISRRRCSFERSNVMWQPKHMGA